ncbi:acetyl-CoA hydrolase/transferase C-terminal domain-containing protein [Desulfoglaeba alkanexedens]|jgi:acetyl-CoA hydrolase/succinyl-CoA:acetate CoA-transferase|uniref:Acetyl-CoA hydrolase n=1 Tax=Desulfoglaeba alkanexedens ALDC TaxID=980445 RepID=A0A4P8L4I8_9BACT|nr:acetyl-CoA hydrolase/transferase C-terminal domain-containing protein [Desulfoglaeba alkanexedens]QCQ21692.1 acetyl-CoA hydrolase [Desulfoglaeba alkanexedens ALDC]
MPIERIRYLPLRGKITDAVSAAQCIQDGTNLFISGFTAGYPKLIPQELARRARAGERFKINLFAGASTEDTVDGILAEAGVLAWRRPYMSDRIMREKINRGDIYFKDDHLSSLSEQVRAGNLGTADVAVVEAVCITEKGHLIPTMSVGNTPTYVREGRRIIIEISDLPIELQGLHDIFIPEDPPYRMPIPIYRAADRIGKPFIELDPNRVEAILFSREQDRYPIFHEPDEVSRRIAEQILDFVRHEIRKDRLSPTLPWQSGVGDVANAVLAGFLEDDFFQEIEIYSEVLQDSVLDLIDIGKVRAASGSSLTLSDKARRRFFNEIYRYREKIVLRPVEISNSPEVIRRLGVLAINTAIEVDIYGQVNSTHVMGTHLMNGIGGSGDFLRNGAVSFIVTPSTAKEGRISAIVPMVTHVDHSEHSVDVVVTENGLVDTRSLTPRQTAEQIIRRCAHPDYRDMLWDYFQRALKERGGHEPHVLEDAFFMHRRFMETGDMRPR